ncbi:MAG: aldehyde dehydrogenase family protein [Thermoplasmata archaeon]
MLLVKNKFTGEVIAELKETSREVAETVLKNSVKAFKEISGLPAYKRSEYLLDASERITKNSDDLARTIAMEAGKPVKYSRKEVKRAAFTVKSSGLEAVRIHGETVPFDVEPRGEGRFAYYIRVPIGPVFSITPFNDPLNLVVHKVGPAIAAGNSIVNKPTTLTPLSSIKLEEIFKGTDLPKHSYQNIIAGGESDVTKFFLSSDAMKKVTFTGGTEAAEKMVKNAGPKKYSMELGSNSPVIIFEDSNWQDSVDSIVDAAFEAQGQNCIHSQRLIVHKKLLKEFTEAVIKSTKKLKIGNPLDETTDIGPMISEGEAKRVEKWVNDAKTAGGKVLIGGRREGSIYYPTVMDDVPKSATIWKNEVFGPVTIIIPFETVKDAIETANDVPYGLQAGVFTSNIDTAIKMIDSLDFGTVLINDTSDFRVDTMPFGGMKKSGIGREGIRFAVEEMTEIKLAIFRM